MKGHRITETTTGPREGKTGRVGPSDPDFDLQDRSGVSGPHFDLCGQTCVGGPGFDQRGKTHDGGPGFDQRGKTRDSDTDFDQSGKSRDSGPNFDQSGFEQSGKSLDSVPDCGQSRDTRDNGPDDPSGKPPDFDVTCSLCLDVFRSPRLLPCRHSFCLSCLHNLVSHSSTPSSGPSASFTCPQCRREVHLPAGGVTGFPEDASFLLKDLELARKRHDSVQNTLSVDAGNRKPSTLGETGKLERLPPEHGGLVTRSEVARAQAEDSTAGRTVVVIGKSGRSRGLFIRFKRQRKSTASTGLPPEKLPVYLPSEGPWQPMGCNIQ